MCILSVSYLLNSDCSIMFLTNLTMQPTTISFLQFFSCCLLSHSSFALDLILLSLAHLRTLTQSTWPALSGSLTLAALINRIIELGHLFLLPHRFSTLSVHMGH